MRLSLRSGAEEAGKGPGLAILVFLMLAILAEGCYLVVLRRNIERQADELIETSVELRTLKNAKTNLNEELSFIMRSTGGQAHGDADNGQD